MIDTDAGTDDAWALLMCLAAHKNESIPFKIEAITCTHGNTTVDNVTKNVTRTLQTVNETTASYSIQHSTNIILYYT